LESNHFNSIKLHSRPLMSLSGLLHPKEVVQKRPQVLPKIYGNPPPPFWSRTSDRAGRTEPPIMTSPVVKVPVHIQLLCQVH